MRRLVVKVIDLYQKTLSPDHGFFKHYHPAGYCKFSPTCSQYSKEAITKYGVIAGAVKSISRILRCNPWNKGGFDPVK